MLKLQTQPSAETSQRPLRLEHEILVLDLDISIRSEKCAASQPRQDEPLPVVSRKAHESRSPDVDFVLQGYQGECTVSRVADDVHEPSIGEELPKNEHVLNMLRSLVPPSRFALLSSHL